MEVSEETVRHLADLADISLSEAEAKRLEGDLQGIVNYISQLDELDVTGAEPTYQVFEMENVWREDEILPQEVDREGLLALTVESVDNQIKVPKVL